MSVAEYFEDPPTPLAQDPGKCIDVNPSCKFWKEHGHCEEIAKFMVPSVFCFIFSLNVEPSICIVLPLVSSVKNVLRMIMHVMQKTENELGCLK